MANQPLKIVYRNKLCCSLYINPSGHLLTRLPGVRRLRWVHRVIMEQHIGRSLNTTEIVHHRNHNPADNSIDNLELLSREAHTSRHGGGRSTLTCTHCGNSYSRKNSKTQGSYFCSNSCRSKSYWQKRLAI